MNAKLQNFVKFIKSLPGTLFIIIVFVFLFVFVNLIITVKSKHESAYSVLNREYEQSMLKLQDTRVHNWSEVEEKK